MNMKEIKYIAYEDFAKLTKKQKLEFPEEFYFEDVEIINLLMIPTHKKLGEYKAGHFFALTNKGWFKPYIYDCWQIVSEIDNPAQIRYMILKGDFENDGINIFRFVDEHHKAYLSFRGEIIIKKIK